MAFIVTTLVIAALRVLQLLGCVWVFGAWLDGQYGWAALAFGSVFLVEAAAMFLRVAATMFLVGEVLS